MPREAQTDPRVTREDKARHLYLWGDGQQWKVTFAHVTIGRFLRSASTYVHDLDQLVWLVISMDLLFDFAIYVTQVHASIPPTMSST